MKSLGRLFLLSAALSVVSVPLFSEELRSSSVVVTTLAEAREPQAAVSEDGKIFVVYGSGNTLFCAMSTDGGKSYRPAVRVGEAGNLALGMRRGPRIAIADNTLVVTAVYGVQGGGRDGELLAWRSEDSGKSWQGPVKVNDVLGAAREGLHGMAASVKGEVACAWLDLRSKGTKIYASVSRDGSKVWSVNRLVYQSPDGTVCQCCHPSLTYDKGGNLIVMWRNVLGGARDMYVSRSNDGGKTFGAAQKMGTGTWMLNACPMDGGALAITADNKITTFWRRDRQMFLCAPNASEQLVGQGEQGWAVAGQQGTYLAWLERRGGALRAKMPQGKAETIAQEADDPIVAAPLSGKGLVVVVWKSTNAASPRIWSRAISK